jgi:hypothetical protein
LSCCLWWDLDVRVVEGQQAVVNHTAPPFLFFAKRGTDLFRVAGRAIVETRLAISIDSKVRIEFEARAEEQHEG